MNKTAIKKFAIEARNKLRASVTVKAGMLGITEKECSSPITRGTDFEIYKTAAGTEVTLNRSQCEQRRKLVDQINARGFDTVIEEVAYTWFNRICAIRFMEVNDYLPSRVRVLSSEKGGKIEPDIVTQAPDIELDFTDKEREFILDAKMSNKSDELFRMLFIKQCNKLSEILPELFEATEDYTEMLLNISYTNEDDIVRMLVGEDGIPEKDFNVSAKDDEGNITGQVEIIGWLYQYYNTELKDDTFAKLKKNIKISKERIPAATQLFTPDWIVRYMVENSVGRLWIEHLRANASNVDEKQVAEDFGWKYYLPEAEQEDDVNIKLAEIRTTYKDLTPEDISCIDPCMGSGHILIAMFDVLMDIYKSAGYSERDAVFLIVENNIHGLDIDKRAYQLAYFAVMMKGRGYNRRFFSGKQNEDGERVAIQPQVYVIEESNGVNRTQLKYFGADLSETEKNEALKQMNELLDELREATEYGSLLKVSNYDWKILKKFLRVDSVEGQISFETIGIEETKNKLLYLIKCGEVIANKYNVIVTNPPYMGLSNGNAKINEFVKTYYSDTKSDLYAVFIERNINWLKTNAFLSMVTQHTWMFISNFEKFRENILKYNFINLYHHGSKAFDNDVGTIVQTVSFVIRKCQHQRYKCLYGRLTDYPNTYEKENAVVTKNFRKFERINDDFNYIPEKKLAYWLDEHLLRAFSNEKIESVAISDGQTKTGDNDKYLRKIWEIDSNKIGKDRKWVYIAKGGSFRKWWGNIDTVIDWSESARVHYRQDHVARIAPEYIWFRHGFVFNHIAESDKFAIREIETDTLFETAAPAIFIDNEDKLLYIMGYLNTWIAREIIVAFNPTFNTNVRDITNQPIIWSDEEGTKYVICLVKKAIELCKEEWNDFETGAQFTIHPMVIQNEHGTINNIFEKWCEKCLRRNEELIETERTINDYFTKLYQLEKCSHSLSIAELYKGNLEKDIRSLVSYAVGCMFGRYSLDVDGLAHAGGDWDSTKYTTFIPDIDNVIPITDEEYFSDDIVGRFCEWLKVVYGEEALEENLDFIAQALGNKGDTSREVIRNYFLNDFIKVHMKIYQKRPIYWLFDSGKSNGFKALIYMHRYNPDTVGIVRTEYLHKTQKAIEQAMERATYISSNGSGSEKAKATKQITKYTKQLAEIHIYDEAMAHIANQRIDIDLDDGVKVNYEKFQGVEVSQEGKKALKVDLLAKIK